jgi:hypothetical protein
MRLILALLPFCISLTSAECIPSTSNDCIDGKVDDQTSLLQVHQQLHSANDRAASQEYGATTTPAIYGTSKFGAGAKATKIKLNGAGDILLFIAACKVDVGAFFFFCFIFTIMYRNCPETMAIRSVVGFMEKERPENRTPEWMSAPWRQFDIDEMPQWADGLKEDGTDDFVEAKHVFAKKNNWPAPKSARFCEEDLTWNSKAGWFAWLHASFSLDLHSDDVFIAIGLDGAYMILFTQMAMEIMLQVGGFMVFVMAPIFIYSGGGAAKKDVLSWQGVGNVWYHGNANFQERADYMDEVQWIWFVLAFATWVSVIGTQGIVQKYHDVFIEHRKHWLRGSPKPQSSTLLVELLPLPPPPLPKKTKKEMQLEMAEMAGSAKGGQTSCFPCVSPRLVGGKRSAAEPKVATSFDGDDELGVRNHWDDEYLQAFFEKLFPGQIESAYVVRKASDLMNLVDEYCESTNGLTAEQIAEKQEALSELRDRIEDAQFDLDDAKANRPHDYYAVNGFVTFKSSQQRDAALFLNISDATAYYHLSSPPLPQDIIFEDLETDTEDRNINQAFGLLLIAALFFTFMPVVITISKIASLSNLESVPAIKSFLVKNKLEATVGGVLASLGLTIMMSMLPTFLMWIFVLFSNKSEAWKQLELQKWYFWFLVIFVLLITCVGSDLTGTLECIANRPFSIFSLLANRMPLTTHFYLNYVIMQPLTHGMNLTRYINWMKYVAFKKIGWGKPGGGRSEAARFKAEPEDQDFYGKGSRSARFTFMLLMGIVFGTICPLMNVVVLFNFFACRVVYGYLVPCVEMRKNDLGGDHWIMMLHHLYWGMLIYLILQVGVISHRSEYTLAGPLAFLAFFPWLAGYNKLCSRRVDQLSLQDIQIPDEDGEVEKRISLRPKYSQNLDEVYMAAYDDGKGEEVWLKNHEII